MTTTAINTYGDTSIRSMYDFAGVYYRIMQDIKRSMHAKHEIDINYILEEADQIEVDHLNNSVKIPINFGSYQFFYDEFQLEQSCKIIINGEDVHGISNVYLKSNKFTIVFASDAHLNYFYLQHL